MEIMKQNSYFLILIAVMILAGCKQDEPVPVDFLNFKNITIKPSYESCDVRCTIESDATIDGVVVEYSTDSMFTDIQTVPMTEVRSILTQKEYEASIQGLTPGYTYCFRCRIVNISATSACQFFTTSTINPNSALYYKASQKLNEETDPDKPGIHTNAFEAAIELHRFVDGEGVVVFCDTITSIGHFAFSNCYDLTSIEIPNSVTSIGDSAFSNCYDLTSLEIPNKVATIGKYAFYNCNSLTSINIPNSVTTIGHFAFMYCNSLSSIELPNSITNIGNYAFYLCSSLTSIKIPKGVTRIGNFVFQRCSSLSSVTIPNGVVIIGDEAFRDCTSLSSIDIPNSVTSIGREAFRDCTSLSSIVIPNSVTSIGDAAFRDCTSLSTVEISNKVKSIEWGSFYGCSSLTSVVIPTSVTSIGSSAFYNCTSLSYITCKATTPPKCSSTYTFYHVPQSIPVYVPASSVINYQSADVWKDFTNIQPL